MKKLLTWGKGLFIILAICGVMSVGCQAHVAIPLTAAGGGVILMGSEFPSILPGRPIDRCNILNQLTIIDNDPWYFYFTSDMDNALRNKTADLKGNVAVRINYGTLFEGGMLKALSIDGMAMHCPETVIKDAGFNDNGDFFIRKTSLIPIGTK